MVCPARVSVVLRELQVVRCAGRDVKAFKVIWAIPVLFGLTCCRDDQPATVLHAPRGQGITIACKRGVTAGSPLPRRADRRVRARRFSFRNWS